jgi:hypothetical protein
VTNYVLVLVNRQLQTCADCCKLQGKHKHLPFIVFQISIKGFHHSVTVHGNDTFQLPIYRHKLIPQQLPDRYSLEIRLLTSYMLLKPTDRLLDWALMQGVVMHLVNVTYRGTKYSVAIAVGFVGVRLLHVVSLPT